MKNISKNSEIELKDLEELRQIYKNSETYKKVDLFIELIEGNGLEKTIEMYKNGQVD